MKENKNICYNCETHLEKIAKEMKLSEAEFNLLKRPKRVFTFNIHLKMDSGKIQFFDGYKKSLKFNVFINLIIIS